MAYAKSTGSVYGSPVEVHLLNYNGTFSDANLGYTGVVQGQYTFSLADELRPFTLNDIGYFSNANVAYTFFYRGQQTSTNEIRGWLFRWGGPYNTERVTDSVAFTLRRR
ncbi:MAG TPA: hypothetical protein VFZ56_08255 [Gemmatimonadaceae bacterium]